MFYTALYWLQCGLFLSLFFIQSAAAYEAVFSIMGVALTTSWAASKW
ncbi:MAG: hypothetical protein LBH41_02505 [Rickettsiales bacterium]|nr:hypothetical protein [Rickettsiales bacterium]